MASVQRVSVDSSEPMGIDLGIGNSLCLRSPFFTMVQAEAGACQWPGLCGCWYWRLRSEHRHAGHPVDPPNGWGLWPSLSLCQSLCC
ncbi:hypothetical protein PAXRUDRAFT_631033 [Paxillus rubicundulus Ve08.2h10]|uniref:Uncharacterized protein n=1 Tax=Paxillus rubicundulus Ve08.2h10 TaxID=930991 RepID=A0A0D0D4J6_9AGAM|nr:hypothetical protein PAXRUDRAFT_631033 [Paxillus rubicundulus Ve08.2h10]